MTNWSELKVADLKEELKSRGIPLTGLKLKQQFVDKLDELDAEETKSDEPVVSNSENPSEEVSGNDVATEKNASQIVHDEPKPSADDDEADERVAKLPENLPVELKQEESQAQDEASPPPLEIENIQEGQIIREEDPFVTQERSDEMTGDKTIIDERELGQSEQTYKRNSVDREKPASDEVLADAHAGDDLNESPSSNGTNGTRSSVDQRKRKRRSMTPTLDTQDIAHKRTKMNDGAALEIQSESIALEEVQEATKAAQAIRSADGLGNNTEILPVEEASNGTDPIRTEVPTEPLQKSHSFSPVQHMSSRSRSGSRSRSRSRSASPSDRSVSPAVHSATSSLYIRNFKRPLHLPTLRNHILTLAKPSAEDPIKVFYLDSIRTHAFISFVSVSAASRVRNAMHGTRFPNEPMREPLWIDFIPDDKVQMWIDTESGSAGSGFGSGRTASKKYEVVYIDGEDSKVEAQLREISGTGILQPQKPGLQQSRSSRVSVSQDPTASGALAAGIHPSRAALVPRSSEAAISRSAQRARRSDHDGSHQGTGFRALDELFSSTTTKPKLYYKLVPQPVIDARLDTIRDLRVGHEQMGRTGDEGMKRYSFEAGAPGSREEWVDKGPEFGFGRRGQERLTGFGSSYGGGRGRGGFRGSRRGGDSWRGR